LLSTNPGDVSTTGVSNANDEERSEPRESRATRAFETYYTLMPASKSY